MPSSAPTPDAASDTDQDQVALALQVDGHTTHHADPRQGPKRCCLQHSHALAGTLRAKHPRQALCPCCSHCAQDPSRFPLGPCLFDFLHSSDCASPQQWAPDTWRAAFGKRHADAPVFLGLFRAGRAGREWALVTSKHVTVTLQAIEGISSCQWERRVRAVAAALSTRLAGSAPAAGSPLPATLAVQCDGSAASAAFLVSLTEQLQDSGAGVTGLSVTAPVAASALVTQYLHRAAAAFPNVSSLQLQGLSCHIPPPSAFSKVTQISMVLPSQHAQVPSSLPPYITQLTSLALTTEPSTDLQLPWPTLFPRKTVTHTLTHLSVSAVFDDGLMQALLTQAPALTHITVRDVDAWLGDYSRRQWGVEQLTLEGVLEWQGRFVTPLCSLPACKTGKLQIGALRGFDIFVKPGEVSCSCVCVCA